MGSGNGYRDEDNGDGMGEGWREGWRWEMGMEVGMGNGMGITGTMGMERGRGWREENG